MCQVIMRRNNLGVADQGSKKYNVGRHKNSSWMAKLAMEKATNTSLTWQARLRSWEQGCVPLLQRKLQEMAYLSLQH